MEIEKLDPVVVIAVIVVLFVLFWILRKGLKLVFYLVVAAAIGFFVWTKYSGKM